MTVSTTSDKLRNYFRGDQVERDRITDVRVEENSLIVNFNRKMHGQDKPVPTVRGYLFRDNAEAHIAASLARGGTADVVQVSEPRDTRKPQTQMSASMRFDVC